MKRKQIFQRRDIIDGIGDIKDCVEKASTAEIAFIRDVMANANPDVFKSGEGFTMRAAGDEVNNAPESPRKAAETSNLPPASVLEPEMEAELIEAPQEEIVRMIKFRLPFSEDFEVWETFKLKAGSENLKQYVKANLPPGVVANTDNDTFVKALLNTLFNNGYLKEHALPLHDETMEISSFPLVPKSMVIFLHEIGLKEHETNKDFDLEKFWGYLRQNFASAIKPTAIGGKPTAVDLFKTATGIVAEEKQFQKMVTTLPKDSVQKFLDERNAMRGSPGIEQPQGGQGGTALQPPEAKKSQGEEEDPDVTFHRLRNRAIKGKNTTEEVYDEGRVSRRRTINEYEATESGQEAKRAKN